MFRKTKWWSLCSIAMSAYDAKLLLNFLNKWESFLGITHEKVSFLFHFVFLVLWDSYNFIFAFVTLSVVVSMFRVGFDAYNSRSSRKINLIIKFQAVIFAFLFFFQLHRFYDSFFIFSRREIRSCFSKRKPYVLIFVTFLYYFYEWGSATKEQKEDH